MNGTAKLATPKKRNPIISVVLTVTFTNHHRKNQRTTQEETQHW
jgi:hypothetical protein